MMEHGPRAAKNRPSPGRQRSGRGGTDLNIAGITLRITCPDARLRIPDRLYRSFISRVPAKEKRAPLTIRLHAGDFPPLERLARQFDTTESWSMFQDGKERLIVFHPAGQAQPLWVARFDRSVRRVAVHCRVGEPGGAGRAPVIDLPVAYPLDQLLLMYYFARRRGVLTHAAGMVREGKAYLFAGASGAGKSTFSKLLEAARAGRVLSDERMIVRRSAGVVRAFGTPWAGTAGIARAGSAPLAGIFFLKHAEKNQMEKLDAAAAVDRLLPLASIPWYDPDAAAAIIAFVKRIVAAVPCYAFRFTPDRAAIDHFREFAGENG